MLNFWGKGPCCALTKVFLRITSSASKSGETFIPRVLLPLFPLNEYSLKVKDRGPLPIEVSLYSYSFSCSMNFALISSSGLLEFRNSSVLIIDHLYLRIK